MKKTKLTNLRTLLALLFIAALLQVGAIESYAQLRVTGTVTISSSGESLPGVNVSVQGTTIGTITDINGNYSIEAPNSQSVLLFSFIGFEPQEITVGSQSRINVALGESAIGLEEVVVTALGISRERRTLTYSVAEVSGEAITSAGEINLGTALQGRIAGVDVSTSASGALGSSRVLIRGNTTVSGSGSPLYVIDGVPSGIGGGTNIGQYGGSDSGDGLTRINPDDIESISVLKGGSAAALYGNRASNGVILITTKSGASAAARPGIGVEYSMTYSMDNPKVVPDWQYEYGSGRQGQAPADAGEAIAYGRYSWGAKMNGQMVYNPDGEMRPYLPAKDNVKHFYSTGTSFTNTLAISGGTQAANYRFSISNMDVAGMVSNNKMNRKIFSLNVNGNTKDKLIYSGRLQFNLSKTDNTTPLGDFTNNPNASIAMMATSLDARTLKLENGDGTDDSGNEFKWTEDNFVTNPWYYLTHRSNESISRRMSGNFTVRYNILESLYASFRASTEFTGSESHNLSYLGQLNSPYGSLSRSTGHGISFEYETHLGFKKDIGNISVNALFGGNRRHTPWYSGFNLSTSGDHWLEPDNYNWSNLQSRPSSHPTPNPGPESMTNSLYGSLDLGYGNFLFLSFTGRNDWSSAHTNINQVINNMTHLNNIFYPSVGLSYIVTETWQSRPAWLSYLKTRASWAQVGGGFSGTYSGVFTYSYSSTTHEDQRMMSLPSSMLNWAIKPYSTTTMEAGFDARLYNNRIGVDFTLYKRFTVDERVTVNLPPSASFSGGPINAGEIYNKGVELLLTGSPITSRTGLNWDVTLNMAYNKNMVVDIAKEYGVTFLNQATSRDGNGYVRHFIDHPYGMVAGYDYRRSEISGEIIYNKATGYAEKTLELIPLGKGTPPLNISMTNTFNYKNLRLSFFIDSKWGGVIYSGTNAYGTLYGKHKMTTANGIRENGITVTGVTQEVVGQDSEGNNIIEESPFTAHHSAEAYFSNLYNTITTEFVQSSDYIKLRQIDFGYSLPRTLINNLNLPIQSARFSFVARNLWLIYSKIDNVDPESSINSASGYGIESFGILPSRSLGFSLSVGF